MLLIPSILHYFSLKEKEGEGRLRDEIVLCLILEMDQSSSPSHNSCCQVSLLFSYYFQ